VPLSGAARQCRVQWRISTSERRIVNVHDDLVRFDEAFSAARMLLYKKSIPLAPGSYVLNTDVTDIETGVILQSEEIGFDVN
jgi:hypothetical protein